MAKYRLLFVFIQLLSSLYSIAQDSSYVVLAKKAVFIEPLAIIDLYGSPSIRIGAELPLSYATATFATAGCYGDGYYIKGGLKRYVTTARAAGFFIALSAFYKNENHKVNDNIRVYDSLSHEHQGDAFSYHVAKKAWGAHIEIGEEVFDNPHWSMEWYCGIGARVKTCTPSISDSLQNRLYHYHESIIDNITNSPATNEVLFFYVARHKVRIYF